VEGRATDPINLSAGFVSVGEAMAEAERAALSTVEWHIEQ
jgi:hypothetical protein